MTFVRKFRTPGSRTSGSCCSYILLSLTMMDNCVLSFIVFYFLQSASTGHGEVRVHSGVNV